MTWISITIPILVLAFLVMGYRRGFIYGVLEIVGIVVSIGAPFLLQRPVRNILEHRGVMHIFSGAAAFFVIWFLTVAVYFPLIRLIYRLIPACIIRSWVNKVLGIIPGLVLSGALVSIVVLFLAAFSLSDPAQKIVDCASETFPVFKGVAMLSNSIDDIMGEALQPSLGKMASEVESTETVHLNFKVLHPMADPEAEETLLKKVNVERRSRGLVPLVMDDSLRKVARAHSADMFRQGYFAHNSLSGRTPFQRIKRSGIHYTMAGENVALAPTIAMAHSGLMKSPGHRENILRRQFRRVGIGAMRGGLHGLMFTQDFAN